jgi:predicted metal-dependent HD superfamily phosphohydrolase
MSTLTHTAQALPEGLLRAAEAAHATPPRAYHSFAHVREVLGHVAEVAAGPGWQRPREVKLAALFHDAVYVIGRSDNEARSADLAAEAIATWLPGAGLDVAFVRTLIALTARHGRIGPDGLDADTRHFLDCDMAILGAAPARFDAYDAAIAEEYLGRVPGPIFRFNRRRFLAGLLERERIFLSDFFHERLDAAARANLRRVLGRG